MAVLVFKNGPKLGEVYLLGQGAVTCGRAPHNPIQILDQKASKVHFQIKQVGEAYEVTDLRSANGLFVNEEKVTHCCLNDWDEIRAGETTLVYVASDADAENLPDGFAKRKIASKGTLEKTLWQGPEKKPETISDWRKD